MAQKASSMSTGECGRINTLAYPHGRKKARQRSKTGPRISLSISPMIESSTMANSGFVEGAMILLIKVFQEMVIDIGKRIPSTPPMLRKVPSLPLMTSDHLLHERVFVPVPLC